MTWNNLEWLIMAFGKELYSKKLKNAKKVKRGPTDQPTNWPTDQSTDRWTDKAGVESRSTQLKNVFLVYNRSFTLFFIKNYHSKSDFSRKRKFPSPISDTKSKPRSPNCSLKTFIAAKSQNISHEQAMQACHQLLWGRSPCNHLIPLYTILRLQHKY